MSLFKEQDDLLFNALQDQFNDEDSNDSSDQENTTFESPDNTAVSPESDGLKVEKTNSDTHVLDKQDEDQNAIIDLTQELDANKDQDQDTISDTNVITISDDEQSTQPTIEQSILTVNESFQIPDTPEQSIDYEFTLNIRLDGTGFQQITTTYKTPLKVALKSIIDQLKQEGKGFVIFLEDNELSLNQSAESLNLRPGIILNALSLSEIPPEVCDTSQFITVKLQDGNRKHTVEFSINPKEPLLKLKQLYANQFGLESTENITLYFDGDAVGDESTPEDVELEDDCVVDVMVGSQ